VKLAGPAAGFPIMKILDNPAIIIRHLNYGEADRIVTFFTRDHGLLKGFARGARKSRKRFGAALETFSEVHIYWTEKTGNSLPALKETDLVDLHLGLRQDLAALSLAAYGCELVEGLLGEAQSHPEVFNLLRALLNHLNHHAPGWEARLLFELRLVALAGYAPHFLHCAKCGQNFQGTNVYFSAEHGGSLCPRCLNNRKALAVSLLTLGSLARSLQTPLTLFEGFRFSTQTTREAHAMVEQIMGIHLPQAPKALSLLDRSMPSPKA
jgi:DNA repair protein RecO (recombination protein O)